MGISNQNRIISLDKDDVNMHIDFKKYFRWQK